MNHLTRSSSLRIVYVWDADYPWDVRVEKTCRALIEGGHDVHIVARNKAWRDEREVLDEGIVHRMPRWRAVGNRVDSILSFPAFFSPRWSSLIAKAVREARAHVIIARDLPLCPTAIRVGRSAGIPVILDMAEDYPAMIRAIWTAERARPIDYVVRNPRAVELIESYCLARVAETWVVSEHLKDNLARTYGADRFVVIGNTPPRASTQIQADRVARPWLEIAYLGLLEIPRGIGELIDAIALLQARNVAVRLSLIGSGRDEQIFRDRAAELGLLGTAVEFLGFKPYAEALQIVARADVGVTPLHRNEHMDSTIPNKIFDYMSLGLPVLTSDVRASAELVRELGSGEVFESGNPESLAAAIARLLSPAVRCRMGRRGRQAILTCYNWEAETERLLRSIARVAG